MEVIAEKTGEAWDLLFGERLQHVFDSIVNGLDVLELRWVIVHVETPLLEPRISDRFLHLCDKIQLEVGSMPEV